MMRRLSRYSSLAILVTLAIFVRQCNEPRLAHAATTYYVTNSQNASAIQSIINSTSAGDTVSFALGTYSLSAGLTGKCGVTFTGPAVAMNASGGYTPTAILNGSSIGSGNSGHVLSFYSGSGPSNPCTQQTVVQYLTFASAAGGLYVQTPFTNLLVQYNACTAIPGSQSQTDCMYFQAASGATNTNYLSNTTITHNQLGDANSCTSPTNVMQDTDSPEDYEGACNGIVTQSSINGVTVSYNNFNHVAEGAHLNCPNYAPSQQYVCEPPGGAIVENLTVIGNDFFNIHRIGWEMQPQQSQGIVWQNNSEHDWIDPYFGTMGASFACCYNGTLGQPNLTNSSNTVVFNVAAGNLNYLSFGFEGMGNKATYNNNLFQENTVNTGKTNSPAIAWGCGPVASVSNNTAQGAWGGGNPFATEGINNGCADTTPTSLTGNVTASTASRATSAAPSISPAAGSYSSPLPITLTDAGFTSGSLPLGNTSIWYTTDGTTPVPGTGTAKLYTGVFQLTLPGTVKAVGIWGAPNQQVAWPAGYGWNPSAVQTTAYTTTGTTVTLSSISIALPNSSLTAGGTGETATATCNHSNGSNLNCSTAADSYGSGPVTFTSSNPAVATVAPGPGAGAGVITPIAAGNINITATLGSLTSSMPLAVVTSGGSGTGGGTTGASLFGGQNQQDYTGYTSASFFNSIYFVTGTASGGYVPGLCHMILPGAVTSGKHYDCLLISAPSSTTESSTYICKGTYTTTSTSAPGTINITMSGCPSTLPVSTAYWLATDTDDPESNIPMSFYDCGTAGCSSTVPTSGVGTYYGQWVAVTYGSYSSLPSTFGGHNPYQPSQWIDLTSTSPTLTSAYQANPVNVNTLTRGQGYQNHTYCVYSDSVILQCDFTNSSSTDARGSKVTAWGESSGGQVLSVGTAETSMEGIVTGIGYGTANSTCTVNGSVACLPYTWTIHNTPAVNDSWSGMKLGGMSIH